MIEVEQTTYGGPSDPEPGNCYPACLASVLEIPLEEIPLHIGEDWFERYRDWLRPLNLDMLTLPLVDGKLPVGWYPDSYALLSAQSPRGAWLHCVVFKDWSIVWDPSPRRSEGVGEWNDITWFVPIDPSRPCGHDAKAVRS